MDRDKCSAGKLASKQMEPDVGMVSERGSDSRWSLQQLTSEIRTVELTLNIIFIVTLKCGSDVTQGH